MSFEVKEKLSKRGERSWDITLYGAEYASIHTYINDPEYWFWSCNSLGVSRERLVDKKGDSDTYESLCKHLKVKIDTRIQKFQNLKHFINNDKSNI
jgi:hypothetical protein